MPGIAGRETTYNSPNYHGELFLSGRTETPFLSSIGGIFGGVKTVSSTEFEWGAYDLRAASDARQRLEGADAPTAEERVRTNVKNVLEIHQEAVDISYTRQGTQSTFAGVNAGIDNAVADELSWQLDLQVKQVGRDVNQSFLTSTYNLPTDNTTARKTRGLLPAITTNVTTAVGALTKAKIDTAMQSAWIAGGLRADGARTAFCGPLVKIALTNLYIGTTYREESRNEGGIAITRIITDFGPLDIVLDPNMPAGVLLLASLDACKPVALEHPTKGVFFAEPLAKVGASERVQLYGEFGLEYGLETFHAKLLGITG